MPIARPAPRPSLALLVVASLSSLATAGAGEAYTDEKYGFTIEVPAPWSEATLANFTVPGVARAAWSGPAGASIVAFVQEPGSAYSPRFLVDQSASAMKDKLGCKVDVAEVKPVDGKKAMWMVVTGKGTGGALTGNGDVETTSHWVAVPREKDIVIALLTCPAADYDARRPGFEKAVLAMKLKGTQTPEQAGAK